MEEESEQIESCVGRLVEYKDGKEWLLMMEGLGGELKENMIESILGTFSKTQSSLKKVKVRLACLLRRLVRLHWEERIDEECQQLLREGILNSILNNSDNLELVQVLTMVIAEMIMFDDLDIWLEPLSEFSSWVQTNLDQPNDLEGVASCYLTIFISLFQSLDPQKYSTYRIMLDQEMFRMLYTLFVKEQASKLQEEILELVLLNIQSIQFLEENDRTVQECVGGAYQLWISVFSQILQSKGHLGNKQLVIKSLVILFRDFPSMTRHSLAQVTQCFLKSLIQLVKEYRDDKGSNYTQNSSIWFDNQLAETAFEAVEFLHVLVLKPHLIAILQSSLESVLFILFQFLIQQENHIAYFHLEHAPFINEEDDEAGLFDIRAQVIRIIQELIEKLGNTVVDTVLGMVICFINSKMEKSLISQLSQLGVKEGGQMMVIGKDKQWKQVEIGLFVLNVLSSDFLIYAQPDSLMKVVGQVNELLDDEGLHVLLLCRALQVQGKYVDGLLSKESDLFNQTQQILIRSEDRLVQLQCLRNISLWLSRQEREESPVVVFQLDYSLLLKVVTQLSQAHHNNLHIVLQCILQMVGHDQQVLFLLSNYILNHALYLVQHAESKQIRKLVYGILKRYAADPNTLQLVLDHFSPYLEENLSNMNIHSGHFEQRLESCLEIVQLMVSSRLESEQQSQMLSLLFEHLVKLIEDDDLLQDHVNIVVSLTLILKDMIISCHSRMTDEHREQITKITQDMCELSVQEGCCLYLGNIIMLYSHYLNEDRLDEKVLKALAQRVFKCRNPSIAQSLLLVFARIINTDSYASVSFLTQFSVSSRMGMKVLMDRWLIYQPLFRGTLTKNATFLALKNLYLTEAPALEQLLVIGFNPSHSNLNTWTTLPLKILSVLIRSFHHEYLARLNIQAQHNSQEQIDNQRFRDKQLPTRDISNLQEINEQGYEVDNQEGEEGEEGDEKFDFNDAGDDLEDLGSFQGENKVDVELDKIQDDEEYNEFVRETKKTGGLGDLESGSECLMSELLNFEFEDGEECSDNTEQDLLLLNDPTTRLDLFTILYQFFTQQNTQRYQLHTHQLLKEDTNKLHLAIDYYRNRYLSREVQQSTQNQSQICK